MGKQTQAQQQKALAVQKATKNRIPKEGVTIFMKADDVTDLEFEGDFEAQLTPTGVVCIIELVPDLLNQNQGAAIPVIRRFINNTEWSEVIVK